MDWWRFCLNLPFIYTAVFELQIYITLLFFLALHFPIAFIIDLLLFWLRKFYWLLFILPPTGNCFFLFSPDLDLLQSPLFFQLVVDLLPVHQLPERQDSDKVWEIQTKIAKLYGKSVKICEHKLWDWRVSLPCRLASLLMRFNQKKRWLIELLPKSNGIRKNDKQNQNKRAIFSG